MVTFIELPLFTEQITDLLNDSDYGRFQGELLRQPDKGDVIPHSGGLRKVRMRLPAAVKVVGHGSFTCICHDMRPSCCFMPTPRPSARTSVPNN
jgi:hypothetical protein